MNPENSMITECEQLQAQGGEQRVESGKLKMFRYIMVLAMLILGFGRVALAQTDDYTGIYYIASDIDSYENENDHYSSGTTLTHFYLVPASMNSVDELAYFTAGGAGQTKPYLTTYRTNQDANSVWILKKTTDSYYYFIHVLTGKYLVYSVPGYNQNNDKTRRVVHLAEQVNPNVDSALFTISTYSTGYNFKPKLRTTDNYLYLNVCTHNYQQYYAIADNNKQKSSGMIGVWKEKPDLSLWHLESALLQAPTITALRNGITYSFTITPPTLPGGTVLSTLPSSGYTIRYTTGDGSQDAPTATTGTVYSGEVQVAERQTIKAVVVMHGIVVSDVSIQEVGPIPVSVPTITVDCDNNLLMSCASHPNAAIYYTKTTDNSEPANPDDNSTPYSVPLTLNAGDKIKAIAVYTHSGTPFFSSVSEVYEYAPVYTIRPTLSFTSATNLRITTAAAATVYYNITVDGRTPATPTESSYSGTGTASNTLDVTIDPTKDTRISVVVKSGDLQVSCPVTARQLSQPTITATCDNKLRVATSVSGANIYYTKASGGATPVTPTVSIENLYSAPISMNDGDKVKMMVSNGVSNSWVKDYTFSAFSDAPTIEVIAADKIRISTTSSATIYYNITEDGSTPVTPTTSSYSGTGSSNTTLDIDVDPAKEIRISAIAKSGSLAPSCTPVTAWKLPQPVISTDCDNRTVTITSSNIVYYEKTTNGSEPGTPTVASSIYENPLSLNANDKLKVLAIDAQGNTSHLISYTHQALYTAAPEITLNGPGDEITITGTGTIYYTTNGADPVIGAEGVTTYSGPITYSGGEYELRAIAKSNTLEPSCVARFIPFVAPRPVLGHDACDAVLLRSNVLTFTDLSDGSTYWYAVTSGYNSAAPNPDVTPYTQYTGGAEINLDNIIASSEYYCTVHSYAIKNETRSTVRSVTLRLKTVNVPELTSPTGSSPVVLISGGMLGDKAICSASGVATQEVILASDGTAEYSIPEGATGILTVSFKHGDRELSCPATYSIPTPPAVPTWSQSCDNKLSLSSNSPMAVIHYTLDGSEPTQSNPTYYEGCLYGINRGTVVRAKAFEGFLSSAELDYEYQPYHVAAPTFFVNGTDVTISGPVGATVYYTVSEGTEAEVVPADPADPTSSSSQATGAIQIAADNKITVFKAIAIPSDPDQSSCIVRVVTREGYSITEVAHLANLNQHSDSYFFLLDDIDATGFTGTVDNFSGVLDGNYHTISNLNVPLFNSINGDLQHNAAVLNLMLKGVNISTSGNAGAIANTATGYTRIYNCGILPDEADGTTTSSITGTAHVGGLVGDLGGTSRVINCFSFANISGGTHKGGIVGYNQGTSKQGNITTMIMNCIFYGEIETGGSIAPVYNGTKISNSGSTGLNNFNYFRFNSPYVSRESALAYNCALGAQDRYLLRFEFFRNILNSNRELAMWYVSGSVNNAGSQIGHWVLDKSVAPYPILKAPGVKYPSLINPDAANAVPIDADNEHRNEGRKLGTLKVNITNSNTTSGGETAPSVINIAQSIYINITDKDEANYNFNYKKIQMPYYNEVVGANGASNNNYTGNKVVTGWKITAFDHEGTGSFSTDNFDYPCYNFVDRACTDKDKYSVSGRVFNQGAYYEVPDGVTEITIEPYWATCVYLSDATYDVTYKEMTAYQVNDMGSCPTTFNGDQTVYNNIFTAISNLTSGTTVYDAAVVLVGNYHHFFNDTSINETKTLTIMSTDMDNDNEPDNTFFYQHYDRRPVNPIRFDFINIPGIGMAQKEDGGVNDPQPGIFHAKGWFEITNTVLIRFGQFEFADGTNNQIKPIILHGGIYEQFVSTNNGNATYQYMSIGGNSYFYEFNIGCHTRDNAGKTPKHPVSIAGGEYLKFYLSGRNKPGQDQNQENAECYIDGGKFGEVAGAGMQQIKGNVTWLINGADIKSFFGGGINAAKPITGTISTTISNSWVEEFYGGPKFGDMAAGKAVTTVANNCHFGQFFGAGYGGTSYNRHGHVDESKDPNYDDKWDGWVDTYYKRAYNTEHSGISTSYEYEYFYYSGGRNAVKVGRFYVNYASLSLASTQDVSSTLVGCTIGDFYGGGKFGAVNGNAVSTLTDCIVTGDVFGSGYSAATPTVEVYNRQNSSGAVGFEIKPRYDNVANVFNDEQVSSPVPPVVYTWKHASSVATNHEFEDDNENDKHYILTTVDLNELGEVLGNTTLTINGNKTVIKGDVYGGGALSSTSSDHTIQVNINDGVYGVDDGVSVTGGNIYGGGMGNAENAVSEGTVQVNIGNSSQSANSIVINGSVYGCNNANGSPQGNVTVDVWATKHNTDNMVSNTTGGYAIANVFGGGNLADYTATGKKATVTIHGCENTIGRVFGGGDAAAAPGVETNIEGGRFNWVFGGGNGEVTDANIGAGGATTTVTGGRINHLFGGSNTRGTIEGPISIDVSNPNNGCGEYVEEFFGGSNKVEMGSAESPITLNTTIHCGTNFGTVYGGSNIANIYGNIVLTIDGGTIDNVFGGSKGVAVGDSEYPLGVSADIKDYPEGNAQHGSSGNVTLTLHGGTITNAFGGSNINGSIEGAIQVNVEDANDPDCPLVLTDVFGGGNLAVYGGSPEVNIKNGTVSGNVYGGGNGDPDDNTQTKGSTGAPTVTIGDLSEGHSGYHAVVIGDVYGGGNAAKVTGSTAPTVRVLNKCNTEIGSVYGGGNAADVPATNVSIAGGTIRYDVFAGGHGDNDPSHNVAADVTGYTSVSVTGATIGRLFAGSNLNGTIGGTMSLEIDKSADASCDMKIGEVYGGGNQAGSAAGTITIGCTGTLVALGDGEHYGVDKEGIGTVYGGANAADISSGITLNITEGIIENVFGGNNASGAISGNITVNINENDNDDCGWYVGTVYGGGNLAPYSGNPVVNITNGLVSYDVFGGGYGATATVGATHVTVNGGGVGRDIYGGGALASTGATTVDITGGAIGRNVYGGGLGDGSHAPVEDGAVTVNIGSAAGSITHPNALTVHSGSATIGGNVYGCNNTAGSPHDDVTVNIYSVAHTDGVNTVNDEGYAIANVFGGGNAANYEPASGKKATVNVYGCQNTIGRVFGGGDAAATSGVVTNIQGGRIGKVFGGGNGELGPPGANVNGNVSLNIHGGDIGEYYGGSNQNGTISGTINSVVNNLGPCESLVIEEFFCGGNFVDITNDLTTTIECSDNMRVRYLYGGCNQANITGNVTLNLYGGIYDHVFAGSKGVAAQDAVGNPGDPGYQAPVSPMAANITGNVTLNLYGGTVGNAFGGSNINGNITGNIVVNVLDAENETCPLYVTNIYGGSNLTDYTPDSDEGVPISPVVNVVHAKYGISGDVYGGSKGDANSNPPTEVMANPRVNIGYATDMSGYLPSGAGVPTVPQKPRAIISGSVFGGGDAAKVNGNTAIFLRNKAKVFGNVYGGGNMGEVTGDTKVIVKQNGE